ncbi:MAG: hypothetical protein WBD40_17690, partial [Tepidisphaeraceae bacterium]
MKRVTGRAPYVPMPPFEAFEAADSRDSLRTSLVTLSGSRSRTGPRRSSDDLEDTDQPPYPTPDGGVRRGLAD